MATVEACDFVIFLLAHFIAFEYILRLIIDGLYPSRMVFLIDGILNSLVIESCLTFL